MSEKSLEEAWVSEQSEQGVRLPPKSKLFEEVHKLYLKEQEIRAEAEEKAREYLQKLLKEKGYEDVGRQYGDTLRKAEVEQRKSLAQLIDDTYNGKHGRGELFICNNSTRSEENGRIIRAVNIQSESSDHPNVKKGRDKDIKSAQGNRSIPDDKLLKKDKVLDTRFSLNSVESDSFLEVSFEGTTKEELNDLFTKLKGRYLLGYLLKSFSEGYKPVLEAGEILPFGSCDHHSGYIEGRLIVLPTGRFAVISRYSGERRIGEYNIWWGILDDPYAVPDWSAKSESWDGEDLKEPTQEEIEFMKSIDTEYRQKTGKKYISFEELEAHKPELPE